MKYIPNTIKWCFDFIVSINYVYLKLCLCWYCYLFVLDPPMTVWEESQVISQVEIVKCCYRCLLYFVVSAWSSSLGDSASSKRRRNGDGKHHCRTLIFTLKILAHLENMDTKGCHASTNTVYHLSNFLLTIYVMLQFFYLLDGCKCVYADPVNSKFPEWQIQYRSDPTEQKLNPN